MAGATRKKYGFWLKVVDDNDEPTIGPSTASADCVVSRLWPSPVTVITDGVRST
ncbi:hypothetical protein [Lentzea flaviverrucosa]|uniref:hypothetical protein n=1 Tax=Lentzea flaviverrucosa TaxID=200379 RepID=UPI0014772FE7|nr:hypothetical protein [Lentzea flaviverrucosa]